MSTIDFMLLTLFWMGSALLALIGVAMLVAGWELSRRDPLEAALLPAARVHAIDVNLSATAHDEVSLATDSDARRRVLATAMARMSDAAAEPSIATATATATAQDPSQSSTPPAVPADRGPWEDTLPRVNLPRVQAAEQAPPI